MRLREIMIIMKKISKSKQKKMRQKQTTNWSGRQNGPNKLTSKTSMTSAALCDVWATLWECVSSRVRLCSRVWVEWSRTRIDPRHFNALVAPPTRGRASIASQNGSAIKLTTLPPREDTKGRRCCETFKKPFENWGNSWLKRKKADEFWKKKSKRERKRKRERNRRPHFTHRFTRQKKGLLSVSKSDVFGSVKRKAKRVWTAGCALG